MGAATSSEEEGDAELLSSAHQQESQSHSLPTANGELSFRSEEGQPKVFQGNLFYDLFWPIISLFPFAHELS